MSTDGVCEVGAVGLGCVVMVMACVTQAWAGQGQGGSGHSVPVAAATNQQVESSRRKSMSFVERFNESLDAAPFVDEDLRDWYRIESKGPSPLSDVGALEARLGFAVPGDLRTFLLEQGGFETRGFIDAWNSFKVFSAREISSHGGGLIESIEDQWGGRPEFAENLSADTIAAVNRDVVLWGIRCIDDNTYVYYYFDRAGHIGDLYLDQDDMKGTLIELKRIASGQPGSTKSLDQLLTDELKAGLEIPIE
ncbi:MAG: SMI1/KNR4 family protein [Dokdonella sp.]|nr:SMI1/KNR4 family protein [Dokdonella sp.]